MLGHLGEAVCPGDPVGRAIGTGSGVGDDKGRDLMEVVNEWLDANPDEVQSWVDQATM